jgi:hypothetical protein
MPVVWEFRDTILAVTESGVVPNEEIERVSVREALLDARSGPGTRLLWDARGSQTPLSAEDIAWRVDTLSSLAERGLLSRLALVVRGERRMTVGLGRSEMPKALRALQFDVFTEESQAVAWLRA